MIRKFLQACCVLLIRPSLNYEVTISVFPNSHSSPYSDFSEGYIFLLSEGSPSTLDGSWVWQRIQRHCEFFIMSYMWDMTEMLLRTKTLIFLCVVYMHAYVHADVLAHVLIKGYLFTCRGRRLSSCISYYHPFSTSSFETDSLTVLIIYVNWLFHTEIMED